MRRSLAIAYGLYLGERRCVAAFGHHAACINEQVARCGAEAFRRSPPVSALCKIDKYGAGCFKSMELCINTFHFEYNDVWEDLFVKLEKWIEADDDDLEATKNSTSA